MRSQALAIASLLLFVGIAHGQQTQLAPIGGAPKSTEPASYGLGFDMGAQLSAGGITSEDLVAADFVKGLMDALAGKSPSIQEEKIRAAMQELGKRITARKGNANKTYLDANSKKDGVQVTASGLQFKVLKSGNGASPKTTSSVSVHYEGRLTNGQIFDSSIARGEPASFPVTGVIKGWTEALLRMKVGDKWQLTIPPGLAYGERGSPPVIGPNEVLVFDVELLEVK